MKVSTFDRETLLDLTVNFIPLGMILFFIAMFAVYNPFGWSPVISILQFGIKIVTFGSLAVLTYFAGKAISSAEAEMEERGEQETEAAEPEQGEEPAA